VYRTGPVDLGLDQDYGDQPVVPGLPTRAVAVGDSERSRSPEPGATSVAPVPWPTLDDPLDPEHIARLRWRMDETLAGSTLSDATVAQKEQVAEQYGRVYKTQPVRHFLPNVLADFGEVQVLMDRRLPSSQRRDLAAVTARLAGLVSMSMVNVGQYREAREWAHTARLAADEAADPHLRAWVATRAAVAHLHFGDPHAATAAAREAELLTRHQPGAITAMAWAILARAAGQTGDAVLALRALRRCEDTTSGSDPTGASAYTFTTGQMHFYASHALTSIGDTNAARAAQDAALAAFDPDEWLDPTLVRLDRALCLIHEGDVAGGADHAARTLLDLPAEHRPAIVMRRATTIAHAIPPSRRRLPTVRTYHEVLALGPGGDKQGR
jgi:hypothetical protein